MPKPSKANQVPEIDVLERNGSITHSLNVSLGLGSIDLGNLGSCALGLGLRGLPRPSNLVPFW